jgi:hypothetical protein
LMEHHTGPRRGDDAPSSVPGKPHPPKESD